MNWTISFPESGDNREYYDWNEEDDECGDPCTHSLDVELGGTSGITTAPIFGSERVMSASAPKCLFLEGGSEPNTEGEPIGRLVPLVSEEEGGRTL